MIDKDKFKYLFDEYFDAIRSFVFYKTSDSDLSEDIAQDVFMQVWNKRGQLDGDEIKSLLYKIASDMVVSHYRKQKVHLNFAKNIVVDEIDERSPVSAMEYEELSERYDRVLREMKEDQRTVFLMSRDESLKYQEIAERLGLSVKSIEKKMSAALKILKDNLK